MTAAEPTATPKPPLSVDAIAYQSLPDDWRREARSRTAFLVLRGVTPAHAFEKAVLGMTREAEEHEDPPSWDIVHALCAAWPPPARIPVDGQPREDAFVLAAAVDSLARAHAVEGSDEDPVGVLEQFGPCGDPSILAAALVAFAERVRVLAPDRARPPEAAPEADAGEVGWPDRDDDGGGSWIEDDAERYFYER